MSALSGIEQALWDILGKRLDQPVYNLMGGTVRERIKLYANGWMGDGKSFDDFARRAQLVVSRGFKAMKLPGFNLLSEVSGKASYWWGVELARAVRKAVGPDIELMVDMHGRSHPADALEVAPEYAKLKIHFFEERSTEIRVKKGNSCQISTT